MVAHGVRAPSALPSPTPFRARSVWHDYMLSTGSHLQADGNVPYPEWGWWGVPATAGGSIFNYYFMVNGDPESPNHLIIDAHVSLLNQLDVDIIFLDLSNGQQTEIVQSAQAVCRRYSQLAERGIATPKITMLLDGEGSVPFAQATFYSGAYDSRIWATMGSRPLLLVGARDTGRPAAAWARRCRPAAVAAATRLAVAAHARSVAGAPSRRPRPRRRRQQYGISLRPGRLGGQLLCVPPHVGHWRAARQLELQGAALDRAARLHAPRRHARGEHRGGGGAGHVHVHQWRDRPGRAGALGGQDAEHHLQQRRGIRGSHHQPGEGAFGDRRQGGRTWEGGSQRGPG